MKNKLEGLLLLGIGLMIFKLYVSGNLTELIAPKMVPYALIALIAFFIISILRIKKEKKVTHSCECDSCENTSLLPSMAKYSLFLVPILLGFILTDFTLSGEVLAKRGITQQEQTQSTNSANAGNHQNDLIQVSDDNYFQVLDYVMNDLDNIDGKEIKLSGFVYREDGFSKNQIALARLSMTCCVVDANIYAYMIKGDVVPMQTDKWYTIRGELKKETYKGQDIPVIHLKESTEIDPPKDAYLYEYVQLIK
jgi:putative membrane protein